MNSIYVLRLAMSLAVALIPAISEEDTQTAAGSLLHSEHAVCTLHAIEVRVAPRVAS